MENWKSLLDGEKSALVFGDTIADRRDTILSNEPLGPHPPPVATEPINPIMSHMYLIVNKQALRVFHWV